MFMLGRVLRFLYVKSFDVKHHFRVAVGFPCSQLCQSDAAAATVLVQCLLGQGAALEGGAVSLEVEWFL